MEGRCLRLRVRHESRRNTLGVFASHGIRKGSVMNKKTLQDVQDAAPGMDRAYTIANLSLRPPGWKEGDDKKVIRAPEAHQFTIGEQIHEWTVLGPSFVRKVLTGVGTIVNESRVPVQCSCGSRERSVSVSKLRNGLTKSCHRASLQKRKQDKASWTIREGNRIQKSA